MAIQQDSLYVIGYGHTAAAEFIELRQDGTVGVRSCICYDYSNTRKLYPFIWEGCLYILALMTNTAYIYKIDNHNVQIIACALIDTDDYETACYRNELGTVCYQYVYGSLIRYIQVDTAGRLCILSSHNITYISMHTFDYSTTPRLGEPSENESLRPSWYDRVTDTHYDIERKHMAERIAVRDVGMGVKHILLSSGTNQTMEFRCLESVFVYRDRLSALYANFQGTSSINTRSLESFMPLYTLKYDSLVNDTYYINEYVIVSIYIQPCTPIIHAKYHNLVDNTEYTMSWHIGAIHGAVIAVTH